MLNYDHDPEFNGANECIAKTRPVVNFSDDQKKTHSAYLERVTDDGEVIVSDYSGNEFAVDVMRITNLESL